MKASKQNTLLSVLAVDRLYHHLCDFLHMETPIASQLLWNDPQAPRFSLFFTQSKTVILRYFSFFTVLAPIFRLYAGKAIMPSLFYDLLLHFSSGILFDPGGLSSILRSCVAMRLTLGLCCCRFIFPLPGHCRRRPGGV